MKQESEVDVFERLNYGLDFDDILREIVHLSINEQIIMFNDGWFFGLYPNAKRTCAAYAGYEIGISKIETIKIYVTFSGAEFESSKTIMDKILKRKKSLEEKYVKVYNYVVNNHGEVPYDIYPKWAEAYLEQLSNYKTSL